MAQPKPDPAQDPAQETMVVPSAPAVPLATMVVPASDPQETMAVPPAPSDPLETMLEPRSSDETHFVSRSCASVSDTLGRERKDDTLGRAATRMAGVPAGWDR